MIRGIGSRPKLELAMANQPNARQASFNCVLDRASTKFGPWGSPSHEPKSIDHAGLLQNNSLGSC